MDDLEKIREEINTIDREMAALFERRMAAAGRVAAYKKEHGLPVLDATREKALLEKNRTLLKDTTLGSYYSSFLKHLVGLSRQYQQILLGEGVVAYQGAENGFAYAVLEDYFPHASPLSCPTFEGVFEAVEAGRAAHGVLPFENSSTGDVLGILDLCYNHRCYVAAMYDLPVRQNLLALPGASLADIKTVVSHVQALEQCRRFLDSLSVERVPFANTALAAEHVAARQDKSQAAIASLAAGERCGLVPLARDISTQAENTTRFIIITRTPPTQGDRFSLLLSVENKVGMLARVIEVVAAHGFDMENIKSRPMPRRPFEYYFYLELVGESHTSEMNALLEELRTVCLEARLLGSYFRVGPREDDF